MVRYLVEERSADVNAKMNGGDIALLLAAEKENWDVVPYLVDIGSLNVDTKNDGKGKTALMYAASSDNIDMVRYLIEECSADVNAQDNNGDTTLICSSNENKLDIVQYLVEQCSANVNITNNRGQNALRIAADRGYHGVQRILTRFILPTRRPNQRIQSQRENYSTSNSSAPGVHGKDTWSISPSELEFTVFSRKNIGGDFLAKWLDAEVVAKLFVTDAAHSSFEDEVHLWQKLRHPNLIKMYGACDTGPLLKFFVCEYASKGSLQELVASSSVEERGIWKYLYEAALGLEFLHERGIVHGDLRCSNILISGDDLAKLSNFGRSERMKRSSNEDGPKDGIDGSLRWQAPEVLNGNSPTYESDVYSLGMCILEAGTGKVPWSDSHEDWAKRFKTEWWPERNESEWRGRRGDPGYPYNMNLSWEVTNLIWRMCCHDPHKRTSLPSVVYELERIAARESINLSQPEHKPASSYEYGKREEVWVKLKTYMVTCCDTQYRRLFNAIQRVYDFMRESIRHASLLERLFSLLTDFYQMVKMTPTQAHIMRLSSTRATSTSLYSLQWRVDALLASLDEGTEVSEREDGWHQQRDEQVKDFVSGVADTYLLLKDLKSPEERSAFLNRLKAEMNNPQGKYSPEQLAMIQKAYDDLSSKLDKEGELSELVPDWFIPWYELIVDEWNCLDTGGFGSVLRAKWLDSEVVVKRVLLPGSHVNYDQFASDASQFSLSMSIRADPTDTQVHESTANRAETLAIFRREVDIWFGFSHPHVVRLFGACHVGRPFFVCEYASNGTLVSYLKTNPDQLWSKVHEAALGVQYLHARKVVHGDLKGNNIVIGSDMKAKVTDFGLSSFADNEATTQVSGAWHWVAPECLSADNPRPTSASDIYSLGMCIVEALRVVETVKTGSRTLPCLPWGNQDNHVVKYHVTRGTMPSRPAICDDYQWELVTRMCALNPEDRLKISTVVDELAMFVADTNANNQDDNDNLADADAGTARMVPVEMKSVPAMIAAAKDLLARQRNNPSQHDELLSLCASLWDRLEVIREHIDDDCCTAFCSVVADANACTIRLEESNKRVSFAETTMRWYALHRRLDKFCDAYFIVSEAPCWELSVVSEQRIPDVTIVEGGSESGGCGSIVDGFKDALQTPEEREQVSCDCTCTTM